MASCLVVVPCFDEEKRLDRRAFAELANAEDVGLLFVDDGSTDGTADMLAELAAEHPDSVSVLRLPRNGGKGEAVRAGMLAGLRSGKPIVAYADADLATPPEELLRLRDHVGEDGPSVVVGSRILIMGSHIQRRVTRHFMGRVFATFASNIIRMPFYDTQCGAKFFRDTRSLRTALARPFLSRWAFDVELIGRLRIGTADVPGLPMSEFLEVPLKKWVDVPDAKLGFGGMVQSAADLARVHADLRRMRRAQADVRSRTS